MYATLGGGQFPTVPLEIQITPRKQSPLTFNSILLASTMNWFLPLRTPFDSLMSLNGILKTNEIILHVISG